MKGNALIEFLLRKTGKTWDDVVEPSASINDTESWKSRRVCLMTLLKRVIPLLKKILL